MVLILYLRVHACSAPSDAEGVLMEGTAQGPAGDHSTECAPVVGRLEGPTSSSVNAIPGASLYAIPSDSLRRNRKP